MNAEHLLDAMGLLDDDLIQEAERYSRPQRQYGVWIGWAASFAVVLAIGYSLPHLGMGGGAAENGASGGAANPAASTSDQWFPEIPGGSELPITGGSWENPEEPDSEVPNNSGDAAPGEGETWPAIQVDGTLYWSTGKVLAGEVDESAVRTVTGYNSTLPQMDGQTNFSPDLTARYAVTDLGLVVLLDGEWTLFTAVPPWDAAE